MYRRWDVLPELRDQERQRVIADVPSVKMQNFEASVGGIKMREPSHADRRINVYRIDARRAQSRQGSAGGRGGVIGRTTSRSSLPRVATERMGR
ncbi:hypothetical protein OMR07_17085 [Methylobacterium organophilum]|nr:hypothetical protein [Methylobacterium organophilum]